MSEKYRVTIELTAEEAENLKGSRLKHSTEVVMDKVQREVLKQIEIAKATKDLDLYSTYGPNGFGTYLPEEVSTMLKK